MTNTENLTAGTVVVSTMGHMVVVVHNTPSAKRPGQVYVEYKGGDRGWVTPARVVGPIR